MGGKERQSGFSTVQRGGTGDSREERNGQMGVSALTPDTMLKLWLVLTLMAWVCDHAAARVLISTAYITTKDHVDIFVWDTIWTMLMSKDCGELAWPLTG